MIKVIVTAFTVSMDGFGAGPNQTLAKPMGEGTENLHQWMFNTRMFQQMIGKEGGTEDVNNDFAEQSMQNMGAWIMGRNMFAHSRGPWPDDDWKGWWGANPPYHCPVFVLTHYKGDPIEMEGGTTFYFVTDGIVSALEQAKKVAGDKDIRIGGGADTVRQYLQAGLVDEMHLVFSPVFIGKGESLLSGIDLPALGFTVVETTIAEKALHVVLKKELKP